MQLCAAAILVLLLPLVPRVEAGQSASTDVQAALAAEAAMPGGDGLAAMQVPLLLGTPGGIHSEEM